MDRHLWVLLLTSTCSCSFWQLFPWQAGQSAASEGLVFGRSWLSARSCSAVKICHSHFPCPGLPLNIHLRTLPQGSCLALQNCLLSLALGGYDFSSTVTLWKHLKDRRGYGLLQPVHPFFKHMTLSSQKNMPIST